MEFPKIGYPATVTVSGAEVLIYNVWGGGDYPVHGAYFSGGEEWEWVISAWTRDGKKVKDLQSPLDLVIDFNDN